MSHLYTHNMLTGAHPRAYNEEPTVEISAERNRDIENSREKNNTPDGPLQDHDWFLSLPEITDLILCVPPYPFSFLIPIDTC